MALCIYGIPISTKHMKIHFFFPPFRFSYEGECPPILLIVKMENLEINDTTSLNHERVSNKMNIHNVKSPKWEI